MYAIVRTYIIQCQDYAVVRAKWVISFVAFFKREHVLLNKVRPEVDRTEEARTEEART